MTDNKITVKFLRSELSKRGLSTAGLKADLLLLYKEAIGAELLQEDSHTKPTEAKDEHVRIAPSNQPADNVELAQHPSESLKKLPYEMLEGIASYLDDCDVFEWVRAYGDTLANFGKLPKCGTC
jgi:SAP domain